jgi:hypothetical protein
MTSEVQTDEQNVALVLAPFRIACSGWTDLFNRTPERSMRNNTSDRLTAVYFSGQTMRERRIVHRYSLWQRQLPLAVPWGLGNNAERIIEI